MHSLTFPLVKASRILRSDEDREHRDGLHPKLKAAFEQWYSFKNGLVAKEAEKNVHRIHRSWGSRCEAWLSWLSPRLRSMCVVA